MSRTVKIMCFQNIDEKYFCAFIVLSKNACNLHVVPEEIFVKTIKNYIFQLSKYSSENMCFIMLQVKVSLLNCENN